MKALIWLLVLPTTLWLWRLAWPILTEEWRRWRREQSLDEWGVDL